MAGDSFCVGMVCNSPCLRCNIILNSAEYYTIRQVKSQGLRSGEVEEGRRGEGEKWRRGEGEKGRRGEVEKWRRGEVEKRRRGEGEERRRGEVERGRRGEGTEGGTGGSPPRRMFHSEWRWFLLDKVVGGGLDT